MLDGPLNGQWYEVTTVFCPHDHEWNPSVMTDGSCFCGEPTFFRAGGAVYAYERWSDDASEMVGIWVHNV